VTKFHLQDAPLEVSLFPFTFKMNVIESQMHLDFQVAQTPVRTILEYLSLFLGHADFHI
jgi:hypothetical protein